ncbi:MAG: UDP-N-acetylmuramate--L-alanine ligase [Terriglobia bacterium]
MTAAELHYPPRQHVHFVGIGGTGMSGIAEVLLTLGYTVSGSDIHPSAVTERLARLGAKVFAGHRAENVVGAEVVVVSTAIGSDNCEVQEASRRQIAVVPRAEMLAELMRLKYGIAVAGSHGKTTTTSLIASLLAAAGLDPTFVVGGRVNQAGAHARLGKGELIVVEADESDRSFLLLAPVITVVTNIDREHLDHYRDFADLQESFVEFIHKVPFYGVAILCADDPNVRALLPRSKRRVLTYGLAADADFRATEVALEGWQSQFRFFDRHTDLGRFRLPLAGRHNVLNALAALAVTRELKLPLEPVREGLANFSGVGRRLEVKARRGGITVLDDYGHHPVEIRATLEAVRGCGFERLLVLFQPHRYTRTQLLWEDFLGCFGPADVLVVTDIYAASEPPLAGITSAALVEALRRAGQPNVTHCPTPEEAVEFILPQMKPGDAVLTLGAGSISRAGEQLAARLSAAVGAHHAD